MKASGKQTTSLWLENKNQINIIDQTQLPFKTAIINLRNTSDFCEAITKMKVRGSPLIGVTAAFGLALDIFSFVHFLQPLHANRMLTGDLFPQSRFSLSTF